jgi:hypothetical protein
MRRIGTILLPVVTIVLITSVGVRAQDGPQKPPDTGQAIQLKVEKAVADDITVNLQWATGGMLGAIVTGAPYSAVAVTETVQTLTDGNRIVRRSATSIARDGHGRVRREEQAEDGTVTSVTSVTILDPVAKTTYLLDPANRTAQPMPLLAGAEFKMVGDARTFTMQVAPVGLPDAKRKSAVEGQAMSAGWVTSSNFDWKRADIRRESLGTQALEGVAAEGTRTVETIPAGQIGNERPIEIVSEQWYSQELRVTLMSRHDDPRSGETLYRLTNLQRNEPDPGLFQVPAGYTVKEAMKVVRPK